MHDYLLSLLLGIVEGVTEFIPVSSTGHLLIAEHLLKIDPASFLRSDFFNVVIQCGAVLAVLPLFSRRLAMLSRLGEPASRDLLAKIIVAFGITGAGGLVLEKMHFKLPEEVGPVAWALLAGGVAFVLIEKLIRRESRHEIITWPVAIAVAFAQLLAAVFPGTSRSGATILFALLLGSNRVIATEFSFLVGIPTLLAAGALKIFKALHHPAADAPPIDWTLTAIAFVVASIVSFAAVRWLLRYVQTHTFIGFGIYRIVVALALFALWVR